MTGQGLAIAGLVLGYIGIALTAFYFVFVAFTVRKVMEQSLPLNEITAINTMRTYEEALKSYAEKCPVQGYPAALKSLGPGAGDCTAANLIHNPRLVTAHPVLQGYRFEYTPGVNGTDRVTLFALVARPVTPGRTGKRFFYLDEAGVIRQSDSQIVGPNSPPVESPSSEPEPDDDKQDVPSDKN